MNSLQQWDLKISFLTSPEWTRTVYRTSDLERVGLVYDHLPFSDNCSRYTVV